MDGDRDEAVESAASGGRNWREAVRALAGEPLPPMLRTALVELGAQGHRLHVAVEAYGARLLRAMADPEEREQPAVACRDWPESVEREAAFGSHRAVLRVVAEMAQAWVEGRAAPGGS